MSSKIAEALATFFYIGKIPPAPGSLASIVGGLFWIYLQNNLLAFFVLLAVITIAGFWSSGITEKMQGEKDPSCIVIDEVAGAMIAFFMVPTTWPYLITSYFLFRAFDMFKLYPVNKFENLPGAVGVMADDLIAGIYANVTIHLAIILMPMFY